MLETEHYEITITNSGGFLFLDMLDKRTGEIHCFYQDKHIKSHWIHYRSYQEYSVYSIEEKVIGWTIIRTNKKCFPNPFEKYSEYIIIMKKEVLDLIEKWREDINQTRILIIANYIRPVFITKAEE